MNRIRTMGMARRARVLGAALVGLIAADCSIAANGQTRASSEAVQSADGRFWSALHGADYASYPQALAAVEAALAESPEDPVQNAHLGWLHVWHLAEAESFRATPQDRTADLNSARQDFKHAVELQPNEARYLGFYATTLIVESATYTDWAYRDVLERRITDAEANVDVFRDSAPSAKSDAQVMVESNFSCMACHRR